MPYGLRNSLDPRPTHDRIMVTAVWVQLTRPSAKGMNLHIHFEVSPEFPPLWPPFSALRVFDRHPVGHNPHPCTHAALATAVTANGNDDDGAATAPAAARCVAVFGLSGS